MTLERVFRLSESGTDVRTEVTAGLTTFLAMAYIIFVQPAVLSGRLFGHDTGMDFGALMTATCVSSALTTALMGLYARYPIALAPGMGENFFFVFTAMPAAAVLPAVAAGQTTAWEVTLGVVVISGVLFVGLSLIGVREVVMGAISPSMKNAIAVGIGLFIAFIGLQNAGVVLKDAGTAVKLNAHFASPDLIVFFCGLFLTAALHVRRVRGSILLGILGATALALLLKGLLPALPEAVSQSKLVTESMLMTRFQAGGGGSGGLLSHLVAAPPSVAPTLFHADLRHALCASMVPFIVIFLFMDVFDTIGTVIGVSEQAGFLKDGELPRVKRVFLTDAAGTVLGAAMGTSTVTSYIESATGVEAGGRTGLTSVVVALLFLLALFFSPLVATVGSYAPITAPALVIVGAMMLQNVRRIDWSDSSEAIPSFLTLVGIPLTYSISDGLAVGFISYAVIKACGGRAREVSWLVYLLGGILLAYVLFVRGRL